MVTSYLANSISEKSEEPPLSEVSVLISQKLSALFQFHSLCCVSFGLFLSPIWWLLLSFALIIISGSYRLEF